VCLWIQGRQVWLGSSLVAGTSHWLHHGRHHGPGSCPACSHLRSTEYAVLEQGHGREGHGCSSVLVERAWHWQLGLAAALAWPCSVFIDSHNGLRTPWTPPPSSRCAAEHYVEQPQLYGGAVPRLAALDGESKRATVQYRTVPYSTASTLPAVPAECCTVPLLGLGDFAFPMHPTPPPSTSLVRSSGNDICVFAFPSRSQAAEPYHHPAVRI
jgi:hypothetical protein